MVPFLKKIAEAYVREELDGLSGFCFVFPNRRSGSFFRKYLVEALDGAPCVLPEITTISDFVAGQSRLIEAGKVEQLLVLYQAYRALVRNPSSFDRFLFWGDMILGDFNDVDRYLVDAKELFTNVGDLKKIQTDFLTDEQKEVIQEYWGVDKSRLSDRFWVGEDEKDNLKDSYYQLWSILYPLYVRFRDALMSNGLAYGGLNYRIVAEHMAEKDAGDFDFDRIVFVGFSTLSASEERIFDRFKALGIADFYWDFESPFFDAENKGSFFLRRYVEDYPSRYDVSQPECRPDITVVSVPSGGGQAKVAGMIIDRLTRAGKIADEGDAIDTAVVLPEEKYLNEVLYSIPDCVKSLNITMGFPISQTPVASLVSVLAELDHRKRMIGGEPAYFFEDVEAVVSHPFVKQFCADEIRRMLREAKDKRSFFVPESFLKEYVPQLDFVFGRMGDACGVIAVADYLDSVLSAVGCRLGEDGGLDRYYISRYQAGLAQLRTALESYDVEVESQSLFFLLSRVMAGTAVAFEGEPLRGLQVMGVLETRLLDFKNLIVLSMNEKVFPTKHYTRSFVPNGLRSAYGMSTYEYQDSMYAYYFYRMISRCENVYLLYDSRTQGLSSGEESRYVYQLDKIYNRGKNRRILLEYAIKAPKEQAIQVRKDPKVMEILDGYRREGSGKSLSASRLNDYIDCPLRFYLRSVAGIPEEKEMSDFIDSATFGTVIHAVLKSLYDAAPADSGSGGRLVTESFIGRYLRKNSVPLQKAVTVAINEHYNKIPDFSRPLSGESILIGKIVACYVCNVLEHDRRLAPFGYVGGEVESSFYWDMGDGAGVNFKLIIDRLDKVGGGLRIVDYKTGSDMTDFQEDNDFASLFVKGKGGKSRAKGVLQVLLYCNAYAAERRYSGSITPVIYKIREMSTCRHGRFSIKNGGRTVDDFRSDVDNEGLMGKIRSVVGELFDSGVPFRQTDDADHCVYCQFRELCNR